MSTPTLIIAGMHVPIMARLKVQQTFEPLGGSTRRRMGSGALFSMTAWRRWKTTISGSGWIPAPLLGINFDEPYEIHSVAPLAFLLGAPLPPGWSSRLDYPETQFTGPDDVTVRLIYPILTVKSDPPRLIPGSSPSWELVCEEI